MKALLLKDACVLYKQLKLILFLLIIFATLPGLSATIFSMIYVIMLPVTALAYDERSKWNQLAVMMPFSPKQLVLSKYLLGYVGAGCVMLLALVSQMVRNMISHQSFSADLLLSLLVFPCIGLLVLSINLPLMFRLGTEKGRLFYLLSVAILAGCAAGIQPQDFQRLPLEVGIAALLPLAVLANLISIRISTRVFRPMR